MRRAVDRYVDSLLRRRRPKDFAPTQDELAVARTAITLLAESPDAAGPRQKFVDDLHRRIAAQSTAAQQPAAAPPSTRWALDRRRVLQVTTLTAAAAAAAAAGATADHLLTSDRIQTPTNAQTEISPTTGVWQTIAVSADLPEGGVRPFDLGPVTGFLRRTAGRVQAVSGICTHQGCKLALTPPRDTLACPCHGATFTLAGQPLTHPRTNQALPSLPRLPVREYQGHIQIFAPQPPEAA
ncbi:MAG: Rieske (2Fe-2S) domain protein [Actinomycetia bacterium]|nr:Rieske (2Fe-2S) domain protein [Actinomycetes bacterium]